MSAFAPVARNTLLERQRARFVTATVKVQNTILQARKI